MKMEKYIGINIIIQERNKLASYVGKRSIVGMFTNENQVKTIMKWKLKNFHNNLDLFNKYYEGLT